MKFIKTILSSFLPFFISSKVIFFKTCQQQSPWCDSRAPGSFWLPQGLPSALQLLRTLQVQILRRTHFPFYLFLPKSGGSNQLLSEVCRSSRDVSGEGRGTIDLKEKGAQGGRTEVDRGDGMNGR